MFPSTCVSCLEELLRYMAVDYLDHTLFLFINIMSSSLDYSSSFFIINYPFYQFPPFQRI